MTNVTLAAETWSVEQRMSARTMCCFGRIERRQGNSWWSMYCTRYNLLFDDVSWQVALPKFVIICSHTYTLHLFYVCKWGKRARAENEEHGLTTGWRVESKAFQNSGFCGLSIFDDSSLSVQAHHPNVKAQLLGLHHGKYLERHLPVCLLLLQCKVATGTQCKVAMWYLPLCPCRAHRKSRCHSKGWAHRTL